MFICNVYFFGCYGDKKEKSWVKSSSPRIWQTELLKVNVKFLGSRSRLLNLKYKYNFSDWFVYPNINIFILISFFLSLSSILNSLS